jgi:hypothetical protein
MVGREQEFIYHRLQRYVFQETVSSHEFIYFWLFWLQGLNFSAQSAGCSVCSREMYKWKLEN